MREIRELVHGHSARDWIRIWTHRCILSFQRFLGSLRTERAKSSSSLYLLYIAIPRTVQSYVNSTCGQCLHDLQMLLFPEKARWKIRIKDKDRCSHIYWSCTMNNSSDEKKKRRHRGRSNDERKQGRTEVGKEGEREGGEKEKERRKSVPDCRNGNEI